MTLDTRNLRELALAATPGEWTTRYGRFYGDNVYVVESTDTRIATTGVNEANAAFIAAANPATVIALLDDVDQLRSACQKWQDHFTGTPGLAAANAEIVALTQQLASMAAARDEACDALESWIAGHRGYDAAEKAEALAEVASLRKVGQ